MKRTASLGLLSREHSADTPKGAEQATNGQGKRGPE